MKVRSGFVSNSSTSSFVLHGFVTDQQKGNERALIEKVYGIDQLNEASQKAVKKDWADTDSDDIWDISYQLEDMTNIVIVTSTEDGTPKGKVLIGKRTTWSDDSYTEINEPLKDILEELRPVGERFGLKVPEDVVFVTGTRMT